jgi:hypothetical protein
MKNHNQASDSAFLGLLICGGTALAISVYALLTHRMLSAIYLAAASVPYIALGVGGLRGRIAPRPDAGVIVGVGFTLAIIECGNIILEEFFPLSPPANAIVPASAMGAMILAAAVPAVLVSSSRGAQEGIIASVFAVGIGMVISCAVALVLIVAWSSDLSRGLTNATMHLILPLIVAAAVGALAALCVVHPLGMRMLGILSLAGSLFLVSGIYLLVRAASLPRHERPGLVLPGMLLSALGLTLLPSILARFGSKTAAA